jgi:hypothetical protein
MILVYIGGYIYINRQFVRLCEHIASSYMICIGGYVYINRQFVRLCEHIASSYMICIVGYIKHHIFKVRIPV